MSNSPWTTKPGHGRKFGTDRCRVACVVSGAVAAAGIAAPSARTANASVMVNLGMGLPFWSRSSGAGENEDASGRERQPQRCRGADRSVSPVEAVPFDDDDDRGSLRLGG